MDDRGEKARVGEGGEANSAATPPRTTDLPPQALIALVVTLAGVLVLGMAMRDDIQAMLRPQQPMLWSLLIVGVPWLFVARKVRARRSSGRLGKRGEYVLVLAILLSWGVVDLGLIGANIYLDDSEPLTTRWLVRDVERTRKGRRVATLESLHDDGSRTSLAIPSAVDEQIAPGVSHLVVVFGDGWFGWRYIEAMRVEPVSKDFDVAAARSASELRKVRAKTVPSESATGVTARGATLLAVIVLIVGLCIYRLRGILARQLGAQRRWFGISGQYHGVDFRITDNWVWALPRPSPGLVTIYRRTVLTKIATGLGWSRSPLSGDAGFDARFGTVSTPPEAAAALIAHPEVRRLIDQETLGTDGTIRIEERGLGISHVNPLREPQARALLDRVTEMHGRLTETGGDTAPVKRLTAGRMFAVKFFGVFLLFAVLLGGAGQLPRYLSPEIVLLIRAGILAGLGLSCAVLPVVLWIMRRRAIAPSLALGAVVLVPFFSCAVVTCLLPTLNSVFDTSPVRRIETRIEGFDGATALLAPWDGTSALKHVWCWFDTAALEQGDATLLVRNGALGFQRIVGLEKRAP